MSQAEHLSAADLASYIDRTQSDLARERTERHLSNCAPCREELAACAALSGSIPGTPRMPLMLSGLGVAAAAVVAIVVTGLPRVRHGDVERQRGSGAGTSIGAIAVVIPRSGSSVSAGDIRFVWRRDPAAVGYRVIVTTSNGTPVWSGEASDTSTVPPRESTFVDGGEFYWRVEASHANGGIATSQTASFRVVGR